MEKCRIYVAVGLGEIIGLGALVGHFHAVAHDVVAACVPVDGLLPLLELKI